MRIQFLISVFCVLFILIITILEVSFGCTGKWWVRALSQLLISSLQDYTGDRTGTGSESGGKQQRENVQDILQSVFCLVAYGGQWSKPQRNWQKPCRCPVRPWSSPVAQLPAALSPGEMVAVRFSSQCRHCSLHSSQSLPSTHDGLKRRMEGRRGERW